MYYTLIYTTSQNLNAMEALLAILWSFQNRLFFRNSWNTGTPLNDTPIILDFLHEKSLKHSEIWYTYRGAFIWNFHVVFVVNDCAWICWANFSISCIISWWMTLILQQTLSWTHMRKGKQNGYHPNSHLGLLSWSFVNVSKVCHPTNA